MRAIDLFLRRVYLTIFFLAASFCLQAQQPGQPAAASTNSTAGQIAALQLEMTNAWLRVCAIVDQPVQAFQLDRSYHVAIYSPGWFHPGAILPDFNTVDVRQTQEFPYKSDYVTSDLTPALMFKGSDLEFNAMLKYFYTNRSLPKKRLTEDEMVEINSQYRIIGRSWDALRALQAGMTPGSATLFGSTNNGVDSDDTGQAPAALASIRAIPRKTRIIYGGIAIGALVILLVASRLIGRKQG